MNRSALIVGHGQPSDPAPAEADMAALARAVGAHLPGWRVEGSTLAAEGALEAALARLGRPLVLPFFIADGYFTRQVLPARLRALGAGALRRLPPFGLWPETAQLAAGILRAAATAAGWDPAGTTPLLAAHGSARGPLAARAAGLLAGRIAAAGLGAPVLGFIEQPPFLAQAARDLPARTICLPLFVARWNHVTDDLPAALAAAGFAGPLLDPLGCDPAIPALLARGLAGAAD